VILAATRQRVGLVAPALEIKSGDLAGNAGEAAVDPASSRT
jgi:hypothetical protein